jgi:hypothetical protein
MHTNPGGEIGGDNTHEKPWQRATDIPIKKLYTNPWTA